MQQSGNSWAKRGIIIGLLLALVAIPLYLFRRKRQTR